MERIVDVDEKLVEKIEISRLGEDRDGFQRKLNKDRIHRMANDLARSEGTPAIMLANVKGKLMLVDGQHRLEAWKISNYPLKAHIFESETMHKAAQTFVKINALQKRVGREHILTVSDDPWSLEIRRMAKQLGCKLMQAHGTLQGTTKSEGNRMETPKEEHVNLAKVVISTWMRDKRWDAEENGIFSHMGTLKLLGRIVREANDEKEVELYLKRLLTIKYDRESTLFAFYGTSSQRQKAMRNQVKKLLAF